MGNKPPTNNKSHQILIGEKVKDKKCESVPSREEKFESLPNSEGQKIHDCQKILGKVQKHYKQENPNVLQSKDKNLKKKEKKIKKDAHNFPKQSQNISESPFTLKEENCPKQKSEQFKQKEKFEKPNLEPILFFSKEGKKNSLDQPTKDIQLKVTVSITLVKTTEYIKPDKMNTLFFKQGANNIYCEDLYILNSFNVNSKISTWFLCEDPNHIVERKFKFSNELENFFISENFIFSSKIGNFIMDGSKWGFLLNLTSCEEIYEGKVGPELRILLQTIFFQNIFRKYAFFVVDQEKEDKSEFVIPSTDEDLSINSNLVVFFDKLFQHQKKEIGFLYSREQDPYISLMTDLSYIPLLDSGFYFKINDISNILEKNKVKSTKVHLPGGILASDVGSGKTVSVIGLISINAHANLEKTLVVVTKNILYQWLDEFEKFCPAIRVFLLEDENNFILQDFKDYDPHVILTFREIIEEGKFPDFLKKKIVYQRIILDEFHEIAVGDKNQNSLRTKFLKNLALIQRKFTWGITGTPNDLEYYNNFGGILQTLNMKDENWAINNYQKIRAKFVKNFMRRNIKNIRNMPGCKKFVRHIKFSCIKNLMYQGSLRYGINEEKGREICNDILDQFDFSKNNPNTKIVQVINQISMTMNAELEKLSLQLKSDPKNKKIISRVENFKNENNFYTQTIALLQKKKFECPICQVEEIPENNIILSGCFHWICNECYIDLKKHFVQIDCPICRNHILDNELLLHPRYFENTETKLEALLSEITKIPPKDKVIIYTQYHSLTLKLCSMFDQVNVSYMILKGVPKNINIRLQKFKNMADIRVIFMSIEQAASGVNLQEANHVFFAHPIFGFSKEKTKELYRQCIGRAYRIGQTKPVYSTIFRDQKYN